MLFLHMQTIGMLQSTPKPDSVCLVAWRTKCHYYVVLVLVVIITVTVVIRIIKIITRILKTIIIVITMVILITTIRIIATINIIMTSCSLLRHGPRGHWAEPNRRGLARSAAYVGFRTEMGGLGSRV